MVKALVIAFSTYSKLPMPQVEWSEKNMRYAVCFFPLVGAVAGGVLLAWCWLCRALALTVPLRAAGGVVIPLLVSGGIHMDGWCDTADALASHQERARKLEILKDSHTGAFAVIACDDRPEMLSAELLPGALERRLVDYDDLAATCAIGRRDFVVSATAGHGSDYEVISQALAAQPSYVGCLGSKRKTGFVRDRLIADGFSPQDAERLHMPIGLPIHAETPAEIAVSIAAQMIEHRRTVLV